MTNATKAKAAARQDSPTNDYPHQWAVARLHPIAQLGDPPGRPLPDVTMCVRCFQGVQAATLPCPGRIWPDTTDAYRRARARKPRNQRRAAETADRRNARKGIDLPGAADPFHRPDPYAVLYE